MYYISSLCSEESSPLLVERYCAHMCNISSTSILLFPASHKSNPRSIRLLILHNFLTLQAHWRVTVSKTVNLSAFQQRCRTPMSSAASVWMKRLPTRPLGASYLLAGMTARIFQRACHALSYSIPPLKCAPSL